MPHACVDAWAPVATGWGRQEGLHEDQSPPVASEVIGAAARPHPRTAPAPAARTCGNCSFRPVPAKYSATDIFFLSVSLKNVRRSAPASDTAWMVLRRRWLSPIFTVIRAPYSDFVSMRACARGPFFDWMPQGQTPRGKARRRRGKKSARRGGNARLASILALCARLPPNTPRRPRPAWFALRQHAHRAAAAARIWQSSVSPANVRSPPPLKPST
eukprot:355663-Chlamydomonas_euryale.AAC.2